uniref:Uncharacterized protein n=1 Tax=Alexandrium catenella TaxID=2925 RepID=A0A7S1PXM6_ALECA|mmetsp:Transcript_11729/g.32045  ORF Transcript_11729/g.32045 Transcript_11729/m.32045 type:complete len:295 (+) Transcript_11729:3-887(+)
MLVQKLVLPRLPGSRRRAAMGDSASKTISMHQEDDGFYSALERCSAELLTPAICGGKAALCRTAALTTKLSTTRRRAPSDTLIIFDWDDTLLCSSALNAGRWKLSQLKQLERVVEAVLRAALTLGETLIVTNGNKTWVQDSMARFLPGLTPLLDQIAVLSARASYENLYPGDPIAWKRLAFKELLACRRLRKEPSNLLRGDVNLIAIGDSPAEIEAARSAVGVLGGPSLVKTVKLKETPSVNELVGQLRRIALDLNSIVQEERSVGKGLVQRAVPAHLDHLASWAAGWRTVVST